MSLQTWSSNVKKKQRGRRRVVNQYEGPKSHNGQHPVKESAVGKVRRNWGREDGRDRIVNVKKLLRNPS